MWNGLIEFANFMAGGNSLDDLRGDEVGRDTVELESQTVTIDTCMVHDVGMYETAVITTGDREVKEVFIMERYLDRPSAEAAHQRWLTMAEENKQLVFVDVQDLIVRVIQ